MRSDKKQREQMLAHCDELRADDGIDPRQYFKKGRPPRDDRKARQLCAQVRDTLDLVLSGECDDDRLRLLSVLSVVPAPDSTQLLVTVTSLDASQDANAILTRLARAAGRLRTEVAAAITRKRAPKLVFQVAVPPADRKEQRP
jgi:ribosome-binding factor A